MNGALESSPARDVTEYGYEKDMVSFFIFRLFLQLIFDFLI